MIHPSVRRTQERLPPVETMLLGLEPGYPGQDEKLDKRVLAAVLGILGGGMSFLLVMMLLVFPEWISPLVFANWLRTSSVELEMATAGLGLEPWPEEVLVPVIDPPASLILPASPSDDTPDVPTSPPVARPSSPPGSQRASGPTTGPPGGPRGSPPPK